MSFKGATSFAPHGVGRLSFATEYMHSKVKGRERAGNFTGAVAENVYPGIDFHSYYDNEKPRYDLIVKPNANPSAIHLAFHGAKKTSTSGNTITLGTQIGPLSQGKLFAYQTVDGKKHRVAASFVALGTDVYGFKLGAYDRSKPLVIDPLVYGSYFGGDGGFDSVESVATDNAGGVYLVGYTMAPDFPSYDGPYGFTLKGDGTTSDAFMAKLQGDAYNLDYSAYIGGSLSDYFQYVSVDPYGSVWAAGRTYSSDFPNNTIENVQYLTSSATASAPATTGSFLLSYNPNGGPNSPSVTVKENYNVTAAKLQADLNNGGVPAVVSGSTLLSVGGTYKISLPSAYAYTFAVAQSTIPNAFYSVSPKTTQIVVMRFLQSSTTVLDPQPTTPAIQFFGGNSESLAGFAIEPQTNASASDPVVFAFGGSTTQGIPAISNLGTSSYIGAQAGYIIKYSFTNAINSSGNIAGGSFSEDPLMTRYVAVTSKGAAAGGYIDLTGLAIDGQGSVYTGGTVYFQGNNDTSGSSPAFVTTSGVFENGQLLRYNDLFVQKYLASGAMAYSALIGGSDSDQAGGWDFDEDGTYYNSGNCIAIDSNLDLFITGVSGSFDFPRTRGVYGETFSNAAVVTVTKISPDASQILYSTNLQTGGLVLPSGIALDPPGDAFVTGNVHPDWYDFPDTFATPAQAGNPNQPNSMPLGTIQTTADALVPTNLQPTGGASDLATVKGFLNILDPAADSLIYGTYLGGALDDRCYGPYVDSFGDVWVFGWVDTYRQYVLYSSSGTPTTYTDYGAADGSLPAAMISPLAFKSTPDANGYTQLGGILFGALSQSYPAYTPVNWPPATPPNGSKPEPTIPAVYKRDGWLDKLRIGLASISSVTFTPTTVPGGLGEFTTGTVTLSQAAPSGGASVTLTVLTNTTAASFSSTTISSTMTLPIAAGATTATFVLYSEAVTANTPVQVQAAYQGSFQIGLITVTPWLQQLSLTPTSVVGGNSVTGRITLAADPPTGSGGVAVTILTDNTNVVNFGGATTVTVPEGQNSITFTIYTDGVAQISYPTVTASLLGVGLTETLTVTLASPASLNFSPASVSAGNYSMGTVTLNGQATGPLKVYLLPLPTGYYYTDTSGNALPVDPTTNLPYLAFTTTTVNNAISFDLYTPYTSSSTQVTVTASTDVVQGNYPITSVSSVLYVTSQTLTGITITPTTIAGGQTATAIVTINSAAPSGGTVINLSSSNAAVAYFGTAGGSTTVTIPAGATSSAPVTINGGVISTTQTATITASQQGQNAMTASLTVSGVSFTVGTSSSTVVGGQTATGTITLTSAAPAGGITFDLVSSDPAHAYFPSSQVTVAAGETTATFTIDTASWVGTSANPGPDNVTISAYVDVNGTPTGTPAQTTLQIEAVGITSIKFTPSTIRGNGGITTCTITLDAPVPSGGWIVTLAQSDPLLSLPTTIAIPYNPSSPATTYTFSVHSGKPGASSVSRSLEDIITATPPNGGQAAQAIVIITR